MDRVALVVGIDQYDNIPSLSSCVADAEAMEKCLSHHKGQDQPVNYVCKTLLGQKSSPVGRGPLRAACEQLFVNRKPEDSVLFYFSGHGCLATTGGVLCTTDASKYERGIAMEEIVNMAVNCHAHDVLLILDCCHSGDLANPGIFNAQKGSYPLAAIREGMTVIAASLDAEAAVEAGGHGLFTAAVIDALEGGAADPMGWVTAPSIYAYVRRRFSGWSQKPVYKSHMTDVPVVRQCEPLIDRLKLRELIKHFPTADHKYRLDEEFEPEDEHGNVKQRVNTAKVEIAQLFKEYRDAGLLKPSKPGEQLFWTARRAGTVELTRRGHEQW
jgi:uncharacterized caspase-like protein